MARSLLTRLPSDMLQAILHYLEPQDYASLRQVSHSVSSSVMQHIPYITLRLSSNSSTEQLQQWCSATRHLQHVSGVRLKIKGRIPENVFQQAMQLLSEHTRNVNELHLLAVDGKYRGPDPATSIAVIDSVQPIHYLLGNLQTLVIKGVAICDLARDVKQLAAKAAACGWQLQSLTSEAGWWTPRIAYNEYDEFCWYPCLLSRFSAALLDLTASTPMLQQLVLQIPPIGLALGKYDVVADVMSMLDEFSDDPDDDYCQGLLMAAGALAAIATTAAAVQQLNSLKFLTVTSAPSIWKPMAPRVDCSLQREEVSAVMMAAQCARKPALAAVADGFFANSRLTTTTTARAAAAFRSLDDCGCWLLHHYPALEKLYISTEDGWSMSWQQHQRRCFDGNSYEDSLSRTSVNTDQSICDSGQKAIEVTHITFAAVLKMSEAANIPPTDPNDTTSNLQRLMSHFARQLSVYSTRPAAYLMCNISSCNLKVSYDEVNQGLVDLMRMFKCLKLLEVEVTTAQGLDCWPTDDDAAAATIAAVAAAPNLQSLIVDFVGPPFTPPADLLLPLTAAAGGPGSSLKKLKLVGWFAAEASSDSQWPQALRELTGLLELRICEPLIFHEFDPSSLAPLALPAYTLPDSLKVFEGGNVHISSGGKSTAAAAGADQQALMTNPARTYPQLQQLCIKCCDVNVPGVLANDQLQQLNLHKLFLQWDCAAAAAAAAAWPNIRELQCSVWCGLRDRSDSRRGSTDDRDWVNMPRLAADDKVYSIWAMQVIASSFKHLRSLAVYGLPWLSVEVVQPLQLLKLQHIELIVSDWPYSSSSVRVSRQKTVQQWLQQHQPGADVSITWR